MKHVKTGLVLVHNYPPSSNTYSYITEILRDGNNKDVESDPIYFHDMTDEQLSLSIIIGTAQNALCKALNK
jgi:hypothetical protein